MAKVGLGQHGWQCWALGVCLHMDPWDWFASAGSASLPLYTCPAQSCGLGRRDWLLKVDEDGWVKAIRIAAFLCWRLSALRAHIHRAHLLCVRHPVRFILYLSYSIFRVALRCGVLLGRRAWLQKHSLCNDCSQGWYSVWRAPTTLAPSATFPCCPWHMVPLSWHEVAAPAQMPSSLLFPAGSMEGMGRTDPLFQSITLKFPFIVFIQVLFPRSQLCGHINCEGS